MRRFFFLQVASIRRSYRPQYAQLEPLTIAQEQADADGFSRRWGAYAELRAAAKIEPVLRALYGPRRDVTEYTCGSVLRELAAQADEHRLNDLVNHYYQKSKK